MSWSLKLSHGDLTFGGASLGVVTNEDKLVQDLRCHILEKMGTDDLHPEFGSTLDGGTELDGTYNPGVIGEIADDLALAEIESELLRIVQDHQDKQLNRARNDRSTYGKATLTPGEVVVDVDVELSQSQDTIFAQVILTTALNTTVSLEFPLFNETALS